MGQNNIGNTSLKLSTDAAELQSGLKKAEADVKGFASRVGSVLSTGIKAALGPVGAVIGMIASTIMHPFDKLKEIGGLVKQADIMGMLPSELAGMNKVLERSGVEAKDTGKVFAMMGKNIQAALTGATDAVEGLDGELEVINGKGKAKALQDMGVSLDSLKGKNYADQFGEIAEAISRLPKGAEQAAAAMAIFGRSGAQLLPSLQKGKAGITEIIEEAKRSGAIMTDAQYRDAARAAAAWKGAKRSISEAWEGLSNQAVLVAAPIIEFVGKGMREAMETLSPVFAALREGLETAAMIIQAVAKEVGAFVDEMTTGIRQLVKESGAFGDGWVSAAEVTKAAFLVVGKAIGYVYDFGKGIVSQLKLMVVEIELIAAEIEATIATIKQSSDLQAKIQKVNGLKAEQAAAIKDRNDMFSGATAKKIEDWFLGLNLVRPPMKGGPGGGGPGPEKPKVQIDPNSIKQVAAMLEGSKEAYNEEAKFATTKLLGGWDAAQKIEQQQLEQLKRINDGVDRFNDKIGGGVVLMAG